MYFQEHEPKHFHAEHQAQEGKFDFDGMNRMVEGMRLVGQLKEPVDWAPIVDQSFLPKELQVSSK